MSYSGGMGRWQKRNPGLPREERTRATAKGRALFEQLARERTWLLTVAFDEPDYFECVVQPGNPGLAGALNLCSAGGRLGWWTDADGREWFDVNDPEASRAFARSIDTWLAAA